MLSFYLSTNVNFISLWFVVLDLCPMISFQKIVKTGSLSLSLSHTHTHTHIYIYIYIYMLDATLLLDLRLFPYFFLNIYSPPPPPPPPHHHHHHVVPLAWISLTLSRYFSLSFIASGRSSGLHPVSSHSCWIYVRAGRSAFARPYVGSTGVHHLWARSCFSSSVPRVWFVSLG